MKDESKDKDRKQGKTISRGSQSAPGVEGAQVREARQECMLGAFQGLVDPELLRDTALGRGLRFKTRALSFVLLAASLV